MVYTRVAGIKKGAKLPAFPQFMQGACYQLTTNNFRTILNWSRCAVKMNDTYITQLISMAEGSVSQSPALKSCHSMRVWSVCLRVWEFERIGGTKVYENNRKVSNSHMLTPTGRVAHSIRATLGTVVLYATPYPSASTPQFGTRDAGMLYQVAPILPRRYNSGASSIMTGEDIFIRRHTNDGCGHEALSEHKLQ